MKHIGALFALCLTMAVAVPLAAQNPMPRTPRLDRPRARQGALRPGQQPGAPQNRAQLEQAVRRRMYQVVRNRVGLDDRQMQQLQRVNQQFEPRRRELNQQERDIRLSLRAQMTSASPDQARIESDWKRLRELQRQRLDILDQEDAQLAGFMTPLQRARYHAVQEQLRRRVEQMVQRRAAGAGAALDDSVPPPAR